MGKVKNKKDSIKETDKIKLKHFEDISNTWSNHIIHRRRKNDVSFFNENDMRL